MSGIRSLDLVIPVYNEAANLPPLFERLANDLGALNASWRAIFVDDSSADRSWQLICDAAERERRILGIRLGRNYGQHAAIFAGFSRCDAEAVVTLGADLQVPPSEIPRLIETLDQGYDVVGGWRQQRRDSAFRRFASFWTNRLISGATGVPLRDYGCTLRAYRMDVVRMMSESGEISSYIPALAHCFTDRMTEIPVAHAERGEGRSRYSFPKLIGLLLDLLTGFSMFPLRALSTFGVAMALGGLGFAGLLLVLRLAFGATWAAEGVFSVFAVLFVFVGAQFLAFGLLGEYIGRIYDEVRRRPQYVIRAEVGDRSDEGLRRAL